MSCGNKPRNAFLAGNSREYFGREILFYEYMYKVNLFTSRGLKQRRRQRQRQHDLDVTPCYFNYVAIIPTRSNFTMWPNNTITNLVGQERRFKLRNNMKKNPPSRRCHRRRLFFSSLVSASNAGALSARHALGRECVTNPKSVCELKETRNV